MATADSVKTKIQGLITKANNKTGRSDADMTNAVNALVSGYNPNGIIPSGTKNITTNGTHDVKNYASATVNVPVGVSPTGTVSITTNGTHDVTNYASANVNVPVPSGYIKPSGTLNITTNGTHNVNNYASATVNVPVPSGYIKPSGTLSITANGTHNVTNYASATVNVPTGITPSGSINITSNGTHNVTNYASAVVNVPTPAEKLVVRTITIASDLGNGTNTTHTLLTSDPFVAAHCADDGFFAMLVPATQIASETNVVHSVYHGNFNIGSTNVVRYGFCYYSTSASAIGPRVMTVKLNAKGYSVSLRAETAGNLKLYVESARIVKAGTYILTLGCWT